MPAHTSYRYGYGNPQIPHRHSNEALETFPPSLNVAGERKVEGEKQMIDLSFNFQNSVGGHTSQDPQLLHYSNEVPES